MYDATAKLIAYGTSSFDTYGNEVLQTTETEVFVKTRSVYQSEYYNAAQAGLKPSITFMLSVRDDYNGEKVVEFDGKTYDVIRVDWNANKDSISLICEERVNGKPNSSIKQDT